MFSFVQIKSNGSRILDGEIDDEMLGVDNTLSGERIATFRDLDGSVTKCADDSSWAGPVQIVEPERFLLTDRCKYRPSFNMFSCNDLYGNVSIHFKLILSFICL